MLLTDGAKPEESLIASIHAKGEIHVEYYQIDGLLSHQFQDIIWRACGKNLLESGIEQIAHRRQYGSIVINDQYGSVIIHGAKVIIFRQEIIR
jgi:hypothetical protein